MNGVLHMTVPAPVRREALGAIQGKTPIGVLLLVALMVLPHFPLRAGVAQGDAAVDWQLGVRLALCAACGLYGLWHLPRTLQSLGRFPLAWMVGLGLWALCAAPFAVDLRVAVAGCGVLWSIVLFVPAVFAQLGKQRTLATVLAGTVVYIAGQWLLYWIAPEVGRGIEEVPGGEAVSRAGSDSQQLAFHAAALIGIVLASWAEGRISGKLRWLLWGLAAVTLLGAKSRTAVVSALVAATLVLARRATALRLLAAAGVAGALVCLATLLVSLGAVRLQSDALVAGMARTGDPEEVSGVSGRSTIWPYILQRIGASPLVGYGYACSQPACAEFQEFANPLRHAHNELLNVALCTGALGGLLLLGMYVQQLSAMWASPDPFPDYVAAIALIGGLTEPVLFMAMPTGLTILWIIALCWRQTASPCPAAAHRLQKGES